MSWVGRGCPGPRQAGILLGRRRSVPGGGRLDFAGGFLQYRSARRFPRLDGPRVTGRNGPGLPS